MFTGLPGTHYHLSDVSPRSAYVALPRSNQFSYLVHDRYFRVQLDQHPKALTQFVGSTGGFTSLPLHVRRFNI